MNFNQLRAFLFIIFTLIMEYNLKETGFLLTKKAL